MKRPWIAFFSHTGKELKDICNIFEIYPDAICCNNFNTIGKHHWGSAYCRTASRWLVGDYREVFDRVKTVTGIDPVITLHGWMKIVPSVICNEYEIYNGHPALINEYPDLKGKDMQEAVINRLDKYPYIGSVIHKCTAEIDCGEILEYEKIENFEVFDSELIYNILKQTSLTTWLRFLPKKINI